MSEERGFGWQKASELQSGGVSTKELSRPAKSILKMNESNTNLQNYTAPITTTSSVQRRRVSFAPEVTLHKFDFVPQYQPDEKRRETIAFMPSSSQEDDAGRELIPDSSDDEDDDSNLSFQALETDADKIAQGAARRLEDGIPSRVLDDDEQTMELTGQIPVPVLLPVLPLSSDSELDGEPDMELTSNFAAPVRLPSTTESSKHVVDPEADQTTIAMDMTQIFPAQSQEYQTYSERSESDKNDQLIKKIDDISLNSPVKVLQRIEQANGNLHPSYDQQEQSPSSGDLLPHDKLSQIDEESEMELTQYVLDIREVLANEGIIKLTSPSKPQMDSEKQLAPAPHQLVSKVAGVNTDKQEEHSLIAAPDAESPPAEDVPAMDSVAQTSISEDDNDDDEDENPDDSLFFEKATDAHTKDPSLPPYRLHAQYDGQPSNGHHTNDSELQYPHIEEKTVEPSPTSPNEGDQGLLKRKMDLEDHFLEDSKAAKLQRLREHEVSVVSTIPLADVSIQTLSPELDHGDYMAVSLPDFMSDIGIQFYDDLGIGASRINRNSLSLTEPKVNLKADDFYRVNNKMRLFEGYELGCTELSKRIEEGRKIYEDSKQKILDVNPRIFREFYQSLPTEQLELKSHFQLIKDYARQQARELWYYWRIETLKNVLETIQENRYVLENDKRALARNLELIESIYDGAREDYSKFKADLGSFLDIQKQFDELDKHELQNYKTKLNETSLKLTEYRHQIQEKMHQMEAVVLKIQERDARIGIINQEIKKTEDELTASKQYDAAEVALLDRKWKLLQNLSNVENFIHQDGVCSFVLDLVVKVQLSAHGAESKIDYSLVESNGHEKFNYPNLLFDYALQLPHLGNFDDAFEGYGKFMNAWKCLKRLDADIYRISLKFPIQFEHAALQSHICFSLLYFSPEHNFKVKFTVELEVKNLVEYASNLSITGNILRANGISNDTILQNFLVDITKNDLINQDREISLHGV